MERFHYAAFPQFVVFLSFAREMPAERSINAADDEGEGGEGGKKKQKIKTTTPST